VRIRLRIATTSRQNWIRQSILYRFRRRSKFSILEYAGSFLARAIDGVCSLSFSSSGWPDPREGNLGAGHCKPLGVCHRSGRTPMTPCSLWRGWLAPIPLGSLCPVSISLGSLCTTSYPCHCLRYPSPYSSGLLEQTLVLRDLNAWCVCFRFLSNGAVKRESVKTKKLSVSRVCRAVSTSRRSS